MTAHHCASAALLALALACSACASLLPQAPPLPASYSLDAGPAMAPAPLAASAPGLLDNLTRRVLASRDFSAVEPASPANAQGGAAAANRALQRVLGELREFCTSTANSAANITATTTGLGQP